MKTDLEKAKDAIDSLVGVANIVLMCGIYKSDLSAYEFALLVNYAEKRIRMLIAEEV